MLFSLVLKVFHVRRWIEERLKETFCKMKFCEKEKWHVWVESLFHPSTSLTIRNYLKRIEIKKNTKLLELKMVEPLLTGIVIGLSFVTLLGLFVAAYLQFKRGNELTL